MTFEWQQRAVCVACNHSWTDTLDRPARNVARRDPKTSLGWCRTAVCGLMTRFRVNKRHCLDCGNAHPHRLLPVVCDAGPCLNGAKWTPKDCLRIADELAEYEDEEWTMRCTRCARPINLTWEHWPGNCECDPSTNPLGTEAPENALMAVDEVQI
jgi:hypothetical protein